MELKISQVPDRLDLDFSLLRFCREDTHSNRTPDIGDLVSFKQSLVQSNTAPIRICLGRVQEPCTTEPVVYFPEADTVTRKNDERTYALTGGPTPRRLDVAKMRWKAMRKISRYAERARAV